MDLQPVSHLVRLYHFGAPRLLPRPYTRIFFNMSTFLFYKPNSNPNRFSRRERFTAQHAGLSSLKSEQSLSIKGSTHPEAVRSNIGNELQLNIHQVAPGSLA